MPWFLHIARCNPAPLAHDLDGSYGHIVKVEFLLHYQPAPSAEKSKLSLSRLTDRKVAGPTLSEEPPTLEWKERIIEVNHTLRQRWVASLDMYQLNPASPTLRVWRRRYIGPGSNEPERRGSVRVLDNAQRPVMFHAPNATDIEKAEATRRYLATYGGYLEITIEDRPGMDRNVPSSGPAHRERLLLADCGLAGERKRQRWAQYIDQNKNLPVAQWQRRCETFWFMNDLPLPPGYTSAPPPALTLAQRNRALSAGEYE